MSRCAIPTLAVLAGGGGVRMGKAKSLLEVGGKPILTFLLERFDWPGPTLLVTSPGREHPPGFEKFDREAVDEIAEQGPMRGLLTALRACSTEWLIAVTVDMPQVGRQQLEWLWEQAGHDERGVLGVMLRAENRVEAFPSLWRKEFAGVVESLLEQGERSMRMLATVEQVCTLEVPAQWPVDVWTNLNHSADLQQWTQEHLSEQKRSAARRG